MADTYWKFVLGGVTAPKWASLLSIYDTSKPTDSTIYMMSWDGSAVVIIGFGGANVDATKAWIQASIVTSLGLVTSTNQAIAAGVLCKTASDIAAGI